MSNFAKEEKLLREIFGEPSGTIGDNLPCGYFNGRLGKRNAELDSMLEVEITEMNDVNQDDNDFKNARTYPEKWIGPEKYVFRWWKLINGKRVAWLTPISENDEVTHKFIVR
jgi:hypothetical protein